ncbi:MAG: enoyl-CoA hydratase/isomerase family protein [Gammaproteobacteria bacterium]|nr:enoyl-CoA hydratase/isomerase family protein [Gammaproteobacteria bacterium]
MTHDTLKVSTDDFVTTVTLSRPERLNALNHQLANELYEVLHTCDQNDATRVFIITGEGRGFSAGADLKDRGGANDRPSNAPTLGERLYQALIDIEKPVIAAINGVAVGGGCTLTLLCDIRVAAESAKFQLPFTKLGLSAELGSTYLLPRLLGMGKAMELVLTSKTIDAKEALNIGLINQVVADDELLSTAMGMARQIASFPPASVRMNKAGLKLGADMAGQYRHENMALNILHKTDDAREAAAAFREKRDPVFTGR